MRYLKKFKTENEMAKFFNSSKYKKGLPFVAKLGEVNDVTFFEKDSLKLKYKMTEDMSEYLDEYKNALTVAGYDNNKMLLTNNGNIYDSFIVNGVEQALPLSEIKHTNFGPIYEENKSTTKNGKIIYCVNGLNSDVNTTFETPFDIENGYLWMWIYSKTLNQFIDCFGGPIKDVPSEELEAMMNVTSDSVQLKKDFIDMVYSNFDAEYIESYGMEIGYSFINEMPNWDGDINEETENYISNNAITCSYTYTYSGLNTEEVSFNDKNIIKDFSITFERPLAETDVFIAPSSDEPLPALLEFSLMMDTEDNQHFTPTPMFTEKIRTYGISFFNIRDTNDNNVTYQMSYREGGVPQVIYGDLETGEYNIEATISPEFYVYNYRPASIEETNEIYNGYMVKNILPIGRIFLGTGGYSDQLNLGLFINEIVIPNGFVLMPEYLNSSPYLEKITIPDSVTNIDNYAFENCKNLTSITIPDSVTSIGDYAFRYCRSLASVTIGNGVTSIGYSAFSRCFNLSSLIIGNNVQIIGSNAFDNCYGLTSVVIPNSVRSLGNSVFEKCNSLSEITCLSTTAPSLGIYVFNKLPSNGVLKVPNGSDYNTWLSNLPTGWTIQYI